MLENVLEAGTAPWLGKCILCMSKTSLTSSSGQPATGLEVGRSCSLSARQQTTRTRLRCALLLSSNLSQRREELCQTVVAREVDPRCRTPSIESMSDNSTSSLVEHQLATETRLLRFQNVDVFRVASRDLTRRHDGMGRASHRSFRIYTSLVKSTDNCQTSLFNFFTLHLTPRRSETSSLFRASQSQLPFHPSSLLP